MGPQGTITATRRFLATLDLSTFCTDNKREYLEVLDYTTQRLKRCLPKGGRHWGSSRKFLNIFMRGALYNRFLCREYRLRRVERWLEVPLDSHVANGLRQEDGGSLLPRWKSVIGLDPITHRQYQAFSSQVARQKGVVRVHLDLWYWRRDT
jgi:hypothetical protein